MKSKSTDATSTKEHLKKKVEHSQCSDIAKLTQMHGNMFNVSNSGLNSWVLASITISDFACPFNTHKEGVV